MEDSPSNAVLLAKLESMADVVLSNHISQKEYQDGNKAEHLAILAQTTKTNGRTTELEKKWSMMLGAVIFMNVIVVPIALALILKFINSK